MKYKRGMNLSEFSYDLPGKLIAQEPPKNRGESRMMVVDRKTGSWKHHMFSDLQNLISSDHYLIFNQSKVFPSRLLGQKSSGGAVECFLLRALSEDSYECLLKSSKKKDNLEFDLCEGIKGKVVERFAQGGSFKVEFSISKTSKWNSIMEFAESNGHIPLPPYIDREDSELDIERYQTVFAKDVGSVAAPTAGLHFSEDTFASLSSAGIETDYVSLHVGIGTFQPIRVENVNDHKMHTEYYSIESDVAERIMRRKNVNKKCIAVGTTSVRTLESAIRRPVMAGKNSTDIFIKPGFTFEIVDGLVTNFHQPRSSLLVMLSAFTGRELLMDAYQAAIKEEYRFFSYGDCMLVL